MFSLTYLTIRLPRSLVLIADYVSVCPPLVDTFDDVLLHARTVTSQLSVTGRVLPLWEQSVMFKDVDAMDAMSAASHIPPSSSLSS